MYAALPQIAAASSQECLVQLFEAHSPIKAVKIQPPFELVRQGSSTVVNVRAQVENRQGQLFVWNTANGRALIKSGSGPIILRKVGKRPMALTLEPLTPRQYHGELLLKAERDRSLSVINKVGLRDYIKDVVASEAPAGMPLEMLKAQAVLAQTWFWRNYRNKAIGDSTQGQCYLGAAVERPEVLHAVSTVWGQSICYRGNPIDVFYHSTCAGSTSDGAEYFGLEAGRYPYLPAVCCRNCKRSPFWKSTRAEIPLKELEKCFPSGLPVILSRDAAGRPLSVRLTNGELLSGYKFWIRFGQAFGWDKVPGTRYSLVATKDSLVVESTGAGHGVGLCQWGAGELARQGRSYRAILEFYFPGCQIR